MPIPTLRDCPHAVPALRSLDPETTGPDRLDVGAPVDLGLPDLTTCRIALVGNAPDAIDRAAAVDTADRVVRFNNAAGFGGRTGARIDLLALVNRGGQMRAWLDDPGFLERPVVRGAHAFLLAFPALPPAGAGTGDGACWTREACARLAPLGRPIRALTEALHGRARRTLAAGAGGHPNPSTGFLVALAILVGRSPEAAPVDAYGFGFSGWPGHPWDAERASFAAWAAQGRLRLHPPRAKP